MIVHPLVLLSTVDHFNRVASATSKRVVGVLLGEIQRRKTGEVVVDVTNSYAGKNWLIYPQTNFLKQLFFFLSIW